MLRLSDNGFGYNKFKWAKVGEWTEARDWNPEPGIQSLFAAAVYTVRDLKASATRTRARDMSYVKPDLSESPSMATRSR